MSNLDLWYYAGIFILGASFSYIAFFAAQMMGLRKKNQKSAGTPSENSAQTQFLRHALVAFAGIMIGAQLLQYQQDQKELATKDIGRDMALAGALSSKSTSTGAGAIAGVHSAGIGTRPTSRPTRGHFSAAESEKTAASAVLSTSSVLPTIVSTKALEAIVAPEVSATTATAAK